MRAKSQKRLIVEDLHEENIQSQHGAELFSIKFRRAVAGFHFSSRSAQQMAERSTAKWRPKKEVKSSFDNQTLSVDEEFSN